MTDHDRLAQLEQEVTDLQERLNSARDLINYIVRREHVTHEVYDVAMRWLANVPGVPKTVRVEDRAHNPRPCAVCGHSELEFTTLNTERDTLQAELARCKDWLLEAHRILWDDEAVDLGCHTAWREALLRTRALLDEAIQPSRGEQG